MLKSELNKLENHISEIINNDKSLVDLSWQQQLPEQVRSVLEIGNQIKLRWTQELFSAAKDYVINRYVQYHQATITQLSDELTGAITARQSLYELTDKVDDYYQDLLSALESLLLFLKIKCYQFFDLDYKVTAFNNSQQGTKIKLLVEELMTYQDPAVDPKLIQAISASVNDKLKQATYDSISYRDTGHTLSLLRVVHHQLHIPREPSTENLLIAVYRLNLNTHYLYEWYTERFKKNSNEAGKKKEKDMLTLNEITKFSRIFVEPEKAFNPELPAIDTQILSFLKAQTSNNFLSPQPGQPNGSRLALDLSVHQFAVFIRVLYKCGCFTTNNISKIVRFFAAHFTTKKTSSVSEKSFARAFYGIDQPAAAVVRDILQRMINYINKTYFP